MDTVTNAAINMSKKSSHKDPETTAPDAGEQAGDTSQQNPESTDGESGKADSRSEARHPADSADAELFQQIGKLQQDIEGYKEKHLRTLADMDNLRRRLAREKEDIRRSATSALIEDLLPSLDNLQIGLDTAERHPEAKEVSRGFEVVASQIRQILERHGLEAVEPAAGDAFDPNQHEAMAYEASSGIPDHHIVRVLRAGYTLNQRLLRPATVIVSSGTEQAGAEDSED